MRSSLICLSVATFSALSVFAIHSSAQPEEPGIAPSREDRRGPRSFRKHTTTQTNGPKDTLPATEKPITPTEYSNEIVGEWRMIQSNAIAGHLTGKFPNRGNPNSISEQSISVKVPAKPELSKRITPVKEFGWTIQGVPFDPGAAEFYLGDPSLGWQYEALSGAIPLGLDANHAHVQPTGKYHYHGLPIGLMEELGVNSSQHSPLIGWAADGFPVYALYGYADPEDPQSKIVEMAPSYQVKSGRRPSGENAPGGTYDGTFLADYEYVEGLGLLDACNARFTVTPEFPEGTYAYFLTKSWPVVPRMVHGTPDKSAIRGPRGSRPPM